jgi:anti-sigma-K factor RskA
MSATHEEFAALAEGYVLGTLTEAEARAFAAHVAGCEDCRLAVRDAATLAEAIGRSVPRRMPAAELRGRVLGRVGAVEGESVRRSPAYGQTVTAARWLALAAALVAAVMSVVALQYRQEAARAREEQQHAARQVATLEQQLAVLQATAATATQTRTVLAAADLSRVDLAGQNPAPRAVGRVFWSPTQGLVFTATNLPPLPPGQVYQLWVVADEPISAGIAQPGTSGDFSVVATPVAPATPKAFAVTIEPAGGRPAPTGPMFLLGSL